MSDDKEYYSNNHTVYNDRPFYKKGAVQAAFVVGVCSIITAYFASVFVPSREIRNLTKEFSETVEEALNSTQTIYTGSAHRLTLFQEDFVAELRDRGLDLSSYELLSLADETKTILTNIYTAAAAMMIADGRTKESQDILTIANSIDPTNLEVTFLLSQLSTAEGDTSAALALLHRAVPFVNRDKDRARLFSAISQASLAGNYYEEATRWAQLGYETNLALGNRLGEALSLSEIAVALYENRNSHASRDDALSEAESHLTSAKLILDELGPSRETRLAAGSVSINLGNIYYERQSFDVAKAHYQEALAVFSRLGSPLDLAINYLSLANVLIHEGNMDQSEIYYLASLDHAEIANSQSIKVISLNNLTNLMAQECRIDEALTYAQRSLNTAQENSLEHLIANLYWNVFLTHQSNPEAEFNLTNELVSDFSRHQINVTDAVDELIALVNTCAN